MPRTVIVGTINIEFEKRFLPRKAHMFFILKIAIRNQENSFTLEAI